MRNNNVSIIAKRYRSDKLLRYYQSNIFTYLLSTLILKLIYILRIVRVCIWQWFSMTLIACIYDILQGSYESFDDHLSQRKAIVSVQSFFGCYRHILKTVNDLCKSV